MSPTTGTGEAPSNKLPPRETKENHEELDNNRAEARRKVLGATLEGSHTAFKRLFENHHSGYINFPIALVGFVRFESAPTEPGSESQFREFRGFRQKRFWQFIIQLLRGGPCENDGSEGRNRGR
jgi:hypothetical protein